MEINVEDRDRKYTPKYVVIIVHRDNGIITKVELYQICKCVSCVNQPYSLASDVSHHTMEATTFI